MRLKSGLAVGNYNSESITITGGGASSVLVSSSGSVIQPFVLPYQNTLTTQVNLDNAIALSFMFANTTLTTSAGGYIKMPLNSFIETPSINFSIYNSLLLNFDITTFGGNTGQELSVFISNDGGVTYTSIKTILVSGNYETFLVPIDLSSNSSLDGKIKFQMTTGTNSIRFRNLNIDKDVILWDGASWSNTTGPDVNLNAVIDGNYNLATDIVCKDLIVTNSNVLTIKSTNFLSVSGNLTNNGSIIFESTEQGTASFAHYSGTSVLGLGNVTIERYIPAKRAWRALTAPLKGSNGSLYATWQNGGSTITNTGVEMFGPSGTNLATGANYSVLNYTPTGWVGVTNTATSNLFDTSKNNAYFVFVTGAYGNGNIASGVSATTLKATGELITGDVTYSSIIDTKHTLIGNPYASPLDPSKILTGSNNMTGSFWVWDPALATTGAYVSYDDVLDTYSNYTGSYPTNTTNIQSGQAFFVKATTGNAGSFTLSENKKAAAVTNVFGKNTNQNLNDLNTASILRFGLYKESNQQWLPLDGAIAGFYSTANNLVDDKDVKKFSNGTENIAFIRDNITMSSEHFSNPQPLDEMYIRVWNTSVNNYKLRINTESFTAANIEATLVDLYTGVQTPIALEGTVQEHAFAVTSDVASTGNRFKVVFNTAALTNQTVATASVKVYPNPATNGVINVQLPEADDANYSYELVNVLGQKALTDTIETSSINTFSIITKGLTSNWYALRILKAGNVVYQTRVIIAN